MRAIDSGEVCAPMFLDLGLAFDTVDRDKLLTHVSAQQKQTKVNLFNPSSSTVTDGQ